MRLLDLFCGAGGAAVGYHRAGFDEIVGIDINPQPRYPFTFIQGDALAPPVDLGAFDLIHASPPCQAYSTVTPAGYDHPDLVPAVRRLLAGHPSVLENVPGAPMRADLKLCGSMYGLKVRRHRLFELSFPVSAVPCRHREQGRPIGVYGGGHSEGRRGRREVRKANNQAEASDAMGGLDWMTKPEINEAIPPAYTQYIGEQFIMSHGR